MIQPLRVRVRASSSYDVTIGQGLKVENFLPDRTIIWVHDRRLNPPSGSAPSLALPSGEDAKTFKSFQKLTDFLIANDTGDPMAIAAFGGGSIGDVAGFGASTYRRGIPFIQVPTTLLAMVDASVGGKTAINHPRGKNMIGTFYQPIAVVADLNRLKTLPSREFRSGLAEVVKHGLIGDRKLFELIEKSPEEFSSWDGPGTPIAVERSVKLKAEIVRRDERETKGVREFLNFGHTLGHALEAYHNYGTYTHGEAIAIGMAAALRMSKALLGFSDTERAEAVITEMRLPIRLDGEKSDSLIEFTRRDKKRRSKKLRMTLLEKTGRARVVDGIDERLLKKVIREIGGQ